MVVDKHGATLGGNECQGVFGKATMRRAVKMDFEVKSEVILIQEKWLLRR